MDLKVFFINMYNLIMKFTPQELIKWAKHFITVCEENEIWYAADRQTLLGTQRHGGFVPWHKKIEVMMTPASYAELKRLFPHNVVDSSIDKNYKSLMPSFIDEKSTWAEEKPFIEIRLIVGTTLAKIKKFKNPAINVINFTTARKDNTKNAINDLFDPRHEGFFTITSRTASSMKNWYSLFSFETKKVTFNDIEINIPVKFDDLLINWYGVDYIETKLPDIWYEYPAPLERLKFDSRKES